MDTEQAVSSKHDDTEGSALPEYAVALSTSDGSVLTYRIPAENAVDAMVEARMSYAVVRLGMLSGTSVSMEELASMAAEPTVLSVTTLRPGEEVPLSVFNQ